MGLNGTHLIDALGGSTRVSELTRAPLSTVHSWRTKISPSRLAHLELLAVAAGIKTNESDHGAADIGALPVVETGNATEVSGDARQAAA